MPSYDFFYVNSLLGKTETEVIPTKIHVETKAEKTAALTLADR